MIFITNIFFCKQQVFYYAKCHMHHVRWGIIFYILFITSSHFWGNSVKGFNVFISSKADVLVLKFRVLMCFFPHAIPNIKHQNCVPTATLLTSTKFLYYAAILMEALFPSCILKSCQLTTVLCSAPKYLNQQDEWAASANFQSCTIFCFL